MSVHYSDYTYHTDNNADYGTFCKQRYIVGVRFIDQDYGWLKDTIYEYNWLLHETPTKGDLCVVHSPRSNAPALVVVDYLMYSNIPRKKNIAALVHSGQHTPRDFIKKRTEINELEVLRNKIKHLEAQLSKYQSGEANEDHY